jgi:regulator of RNase E activity RraA
MKTPTDAVSAPSSLRPPIDEGSLLALRRWNSPTIYNGLEQITRADRRTLVNLDDVVDYMPQMGSMVGYAITVVVQPGEPRYVTEMPNAWREYRAFVASIPGPKIVVCQDLDRPKCYGAAWGEVNASFHRAAGCVGAIVDGSVRDVDDMATAGFKTLARRLSVSHCYAWPVMWGCDVEVFGITVKQGQLLHADKHGFVAVPFGDEARLLEAARFMDQAECDTMIAAAKGSAGRLVQAWLPDFERSVEAFGQRAKEKYGRSGEW